jgi:hypothetical protein
MQAINEGSVIHLKQVIRDHQPPASCLEPARR